MKKYFVIMLMALAGINFTCAATLVEDVSEDVYVEIHKKTFSTDEFERSIDMFVVDARFYPSSNELVVDLHNIGTANVCIVNANGEVVDECVVETDSPVSVTLSTVLCSDDFYVVVDAQKVYAEGHVTR